MTLGVLLVAVQVCMAEYLYSDGNHCRILSSHSFRELSPHGFSGQVIEKQAHTAVVVASNSLNVHLGHPDSLSDALVFIQGYKSGQPIL